MSEESPGAVTAEKIASNAVTADKVAEGVAGGPKISTVAVTDNAYTVLDDTAVSLDGGYIKITGSGFVSGCAVIVGTTAATSTTFISSTEVRAQISAQGAGSYFVYVVNPDGGTATRVNGLTYSASPTWITDSTLSTALSGSEYSVNLSASGASTYSLASGSNLPTGLTLTSAGLLSGTITVESNTNYSFTINATDSENQDSPRTFSLDVNTTPPVAVILYGATSGTTFVDSSTFNHSITTTGSGVTGTTVAKNGGNALSLSTSNANINNISVDISARNINFRDSNWSLGFWFRTDTNSDIDHAVIGFIDSNDNLIFAPQIMYRTTSGGRGFVGMKWSATGGSTSSQFDGAPSYYPLYTSTWYYHELWHVGGTTVINYKIYDSSQTLIGTYSTNWAQWTGTIAWLYATSNIAKLRLPGTSSAYAYLDSVYFSPDSTPLSIPTSEPF